MSLLLRQAHRECREWQKPLVILTKPPRGDVNDLAPTSPSAKPNNVPLNGLFGRLRKSQSPKKISRAENAVVTTKFLEFLGMVPAEGHTAPAASKNHSSISEDTTKITQGPVQPIAEPSPRTSIDSTTATQTGSSTSLVNTVTSTLSSSSPTCAPAKISCALFRPQGNRDRSGCLISHSIDIPVVLEQQFLAESLTSAIGLSAIQGPDTAHVDEGGKSTKALDGPKLSVGLSRSSQNFQTMNTIDSTVLPSITKLTSINSTTKKSDDIFDQTKTLGVRDKFASLSHEYSSTLVAVRNAVKGAMAKSKKSSRASKKVQKLTAPPHLHATSAKLKYLRCEHEKLTYTYTGTAFQLSEVTSEKKKLSKQATSYHMQWQFAKARFDRVRYQHEDEAPPTKADAEDLLEQTQEQYQELEQKRKDEAMAAAKELDECKHSNQATVATLRANLEAMQVELTQTRNARDYFEHEHESAVALLGKCHSDPQIVAAFQTREDARKQEYHDLLTRLESEIQSKKRVESELNSHRIGYRELVRENRAQKDQICQLSSAKDLLEARVEPIEFVGLPYEQRVEVEGIRQQLAEKDKEIQKWDETYRGLVASGGKIDPLKLQINDHRLDVMRKSHEGVVEENDSLQLKLVAARRAIEDGEQFRPLYIADMEDIKIEKNALEDVVRVLKEKLANGEPVDPRSWLHMRECSEGKAQAILRQEQAEEREAQAAATHKHQMDQVESLICLMWRRIFAFEELVEPNECPTYLIEDRGRLAAFTRELFGINVNCIDSASDANRLAMDQQMCGHYRGPCCTPEQWLPVPTSSGSQSQATASQHSSSTSIAATLPSEQISADGDKPITYEEYTESQDRLIYSLKMLAGKLWARIWAFEDIIPPQECRERLWDEREGLRQLTIDYAEFDVNTFVPEEEEGFPEEDAPFHTPDAWMPVGNTDLTADTDVTEDTDVTWFTVPYSENSSSDSEDSDGSDIGSNAQLGGTGPVVYSEESSDGASGGVAVGDMSDEAFNEAMGAITSNNEHDNSNEEASNSRAQVSRDGSNINRSLTEDSAKDSDANDNLSADRARTPISTTTPILHLKGVKEAAKMGLSCWNIGIPNPDTVACSSNAPEEELNRLTCKRPESRAQGRKYINEAIIKKAKDLKEAKEKEEATRPSDWDLPPKSNAKDFIVDRSSKKNKGIDFYSYTKQQIDAMERSRDLRVSADVVGSESVSDISSTSSDPFSIEDIALQEEEDL